MLAFGREKISIQHLAFSSNKLCYVEFQKVPTKIPEIIQNHFMKNTFPK